MVPPSRGGQLFLKKPMNVTKANSHTPKKIFVCCSIDIKVPK